MSSRGISSRNGSPAAQSPKPAHPLLQTAIEVPTESSRLEWQLSQLLSSHQTSLEALLADHRKQASHDQTDRVEHLQQQIGRLGDHLGKRLDAMQGVGAKARQEARQEFKGVLQDVHKEDAAVKAVVERLQQHEERVEAMQKQILRVLVEIMEATTNSAKLVRSEAKSDVREAKDALAKGDWADNDLRDLEDPPAVQRIHDRVAHMHDALHEKHDRFQENLDRRHEETLAKLHDHHMAILSEMAEQVKALGTKAAAKIRFHHQLSSWGDKGMEPGAAADADKLALEGEQAGRPGHNAATGSAQECPEVVEPAHERKVLRKNSLLSVGSGSQTNNFRGMTTVNAQHSGDEKPKSNPSGPCIDVQTLQDLQGWHRARSKVINPEGLERYRNFLESASSFLIILNLLYLGLETEFSMDYAQRGLPSPQWLWYCSLAFAIVFSVELAFRVAMEKWDFFRGPHWRWNAFDTILVMVQFVDIAFAVINLSFIRCLRSLRSLRALRIIKTVSYVRELRLMIASISASFTSLVWSFVLLLLALYLFSLALEQTIQAHIEISGTASLHPDLTIFYGSLGSAMVTLFMAISGGMDWKDLVAPLEQISKAYLLFFMGFITFVLFGMLNILTAVFVEATNRIAEVDQDLVIQEHLDHEDSVMSKVREFLGQADTDGSGTISKAEFEAKLTDPYFQAQLNLLSLDAYEAQGVFRILNIHDTDEVEIEEFIYGLIRLKGNAKAVDVVTMLCESRRIVRRLVAFMRYTEDNFQDLREDLGLCLRENKDMKTYLSQSNVGSKHPLKP